MIASTFGNYHKPMSSLNHLAEFQEHLLKSRRVVALVGAGLSVASGLPTFRGAEGLWKNFNMIDLATLDAFHFDPGLVWQFYSWRRYMALKARPNKGHYALSRLSQKKDIDYITITQNVDGLSSRSDHERSRLYEIHGDLFELKCTSFMCNYKTKNYQHPLTESLRGTEEEYEPIKRDNSKQHEPLEIQLNTYISPRTGALIDGVGDDLNSNPICSPQFMPIKELGEDELPRCPVCGGLLRPGVIWFGESLPLQDINEIDDWIEKGRIDLILVVGTSGTVHPANSYVERVLLQGGKAAIFNTDIGDDVMKGRVENIWGFKGECEELLPLALKPLIGELSK